MIERRNFSVVTSLILGIAVALAALTACSASSNSSSSPETAAPTDSTASPTPTPTQTQAPVPTTAAAMIHALKQEQAPIDGIIVFNARTDANHLLGRPQGYESKGAWRDSRIPASDVVGFTLGDIDVGGGIEVFSSQDGAVARGRYIQALGTFANEYDYACGDALLRVSGQLTPSQAKLYPHLLARILQAPCSPVT